MSESESETASNAALADVRAAIDKAADVPLWTLSRAEVGEWLCTLQELRARFDSLLATSTAAAHDASAQLLGSQSNLPGYVSSETRCDPRIVASDAAVGAWLRSFPLFAEAFRSGVLTRRDVQVLRAEENRRTRRAMERSQELLVKAAAECSWREFIEVLRYWTLAADPDGAEPRDQVAGRRLDAERRPDGTVTGSFDLDPIAGSVLLNGLEQELQRMRREPQTPDEAGPTEASPAQQRADALVRMVGRGAARPDGTTPAPLVHIVMSERVAADTLARVGAGDSDDLTARAALIALGMNPDRLPIAHHDVDGRCELVDGTPIHPRLAAAALAVAALRRLVMDAESERLDLGRAVRTYPRHLKDALLARSRGRCDEPGCDAPVSWLEADHHIPWARDGSTSTANGGIRCRPHNLEKRDLLPP